MPTDGFIEIGDSRLEYRLWDGISPNRPTLVLLHEGLGSVALWRDFPGRLAAETGLAVFAYSRAGYGGSSPCALPRPMSYLHDEARDVLPAVLSAAGIGRSILVGHSDGGSIAALHAGMVDDPGRIGIVIMAPHFFTEDVAVDGIAAAKQMYDAGDLRAKLERHHGSNVDCAFRGWSEAWLDWRWRAWNLEAELAAVRVPVLAIQGEDDHYGTASQIDIVPRLAKGPVETLMIPDCGHAPWKEAPEATLGAMLPFIDRLAG